MTADLETEVVIDRPTEEVAAPHRGLRMHVRLGILLFIDERP